MFIRRCLFKNNLPHKTGSRACIVFKENPTAKQFKSQFVAHMVVVSLSNGNCGFHEENLNNKPSHGFNQFFVVVF